MADLQTHVDTGGAQGTGRPADGDPTPGPQRLLARWARHRPAPDGRGFRKPFLAGLIRRNAVQAGGQRQEDPVGGDARATPGAGTKRSAPPDPADRRKTSRRSSAGWDRRPRHLPRPPRGDLEARLIPPAPRSRPPRRHRPREDLARAPGGSTYARQRLERRADELDRVNRTGKSADLRRNGRSPRPAARTDTGRRSAAAGCAKGRQALPAAAGPDRLGVVGPEPSAQGHVEEGRSSSKTYGYPHSDQIGACCPLGWGSGAWRRRARSCGSKGERNGSNASTTRAAKASTAGARPVRHQGDEAAQHRRQTSAARRPVPSRRRTPRPRASKSYRRTRQRHESGAFRRGVEPRSVAATA